MARNKKPFSKMGKKIACAHFLVPDRGHLTSVIRCCCSSHPLIDAASVVKSPFNPEVGGFTGRGFKEDYDGRTTYFDDRYGNVRRQHHYDPVPFPAFPILRRNSSSSFLSLQDDVYQSGGSVSSFTESDTSHSESETPLKGKERSEERRASQPPSQPLTPQPDAISRPQAVATRSRSLGFPPINAANLGLTTQQAPMNRNRLDTSDNTGIYSGTTTTSRHRRKHQYHFSARSMEQIWQGTSQMDKATPPPVVLCHDADNAARTSETGYISGLDESDDGTNHRSYDGDKEDQNDRSEISTSASFDDLPDKPGRTMPKEEWQRRKAERPPKKAGPISNGRKQTRKARNSNGDGKATTKPPKKTEPVSSPVYLRKNPLLDSTTEGSLIVSGWVAVGFGSDSIATRLREGSKRIEAKDIFYLRIVDTSHMGGGASILLKASTGSVEHAFPLKHERACSSREVSSRIGKYVTVSSQTTPTREIVTILPVSLDDTFFPSGVFLAPQRFKRQHERLFISGKGKVYAPDEQHDAVTYIMFSLDALIKNSRR